MANSQGPKSFPKGKKPSFRAIQYRILSDLLSLQKQSLSLQNPVEASLQAIAILTQAFDAVVSLKTDNSKMMARINDAKVELQALRHKCDQEMQAIIHEVLKGEWDWRKGQTTLFNWLVANKSLLGSAITDTQNPTARRDFMNLLWFFSGAMRNGELAKKIDTQEFWGLLGDDGRMYEIMPQYVLAYFMEADANDPEQFKDDIEFFYHAMPSSQEYTSSGPDYFALGKETLKTEISRIEKEGRWPSDWLGPQDCLEYGMRMCKRYLQA